MKIRLRDALLFILTPWMADRPGLKVLFKVIWALVAPLDWLLETLYQGVQAAWPGVGTPTALSYIGRSRGLVRGVLESDTSYATRLRGWLDAWARAGSSDAVATQVHNYMPGRPVVEVITRAGVVTRCAADGTITRSTTVWNWDGTSNPERAGFWWDYFVVVYTTAYASAGLYGTGDGQTWDGLGGLGDSNPPADFDAVSNLCAQWKSAHSNVRCVILNKNGTRPTPNGSWGRWDNKAGGYGPRDLVNNYFWEF